MSVKAWLAATDDMPAFAEWFGRASYSRKSREDSTASPYSNGETSGISNVNPPTGEERSNG